MLCENSKKSHQKLINIMLLKELLIQKLINRSSQNSASQLTP